MYSPALLDHFQNPRNAGEIEHPDALIEVTNPVCGDILRLTARLQDGLIAEVRFLARGCTASIAAGSALTGLLEGRTAAEARLVKRGDVETAVGGLSNESKHAALLAEDAVRALAAKLAE